MTKKMAAGGEASSCKDMTAGSGSGLGRLQKTSIASKTTTQKLKKGGVARMAGGGQYPTDAEMKEDDLRDMDRQLMRAYRDAESPKKRGKESDYYVDAILSNMGKRAKQPEGGYRPAQGFNKGGMTKMAKGGKAEAFEGSAKDMAQDKKLAKKRGMSLKDWEKSSADEKHDTQQSMKGLKKGGKAKMADGGMAAPKKSGNVTTMPVGRGFSTDPRNPTVLQHFDSRTNPPPGSGGMPIGGMGPGGAPSMDPTIIQALRAGPRPGSPRMMGGMFSKGGMAEGSPREEAMDKRQAKKAKMPMAMFEKSGKDVEKMAKGGKAHSKGCNCMACGGKAKYAKGGMSTAQDGMKAPLRPAPSGIAKMAKGGKVTFGSMKPLPGTKVSSKVIRSTVSTDGANMKKDGMKGQLRAKASGAKPTNMMKPLGMTKMAKGGKVRGTGIAQRGTKFIGEV